MRRMERLNRGLIVAEAENGIYLSWRYLGDEPDGIICTVTYTNKDCSIRRQAGIICTITYTNNHCSIRRRRNYLQKTRITRSLRALSSA